jgi:putative chitinase
VVPGDTLSKIAARYKTTVAAIVSANPTIKNVNLIQVGQKFVIPAGGTASTPTTPPPAPAPSPTPTTTTHPPAATTPPPAATATTHTVVAGDTLGKIAAKYHTTITAVAIANKIKNVNLIRVGQKLTITAG